MEDAFFCPKAIEIVNKLFTIFFAICNGFEKQFSDSAKLKLTKAQWVIAFMEEKITEWEQIEQGLIACRKKQNLIYIPPIGDFITWCTEKNKEQFLPKERAYMVAYEIMRGVIDESLTENQLSIINHAIKESDRHFLKTNSRATTEPVFYRNYEISLRSFLDGTLKSIPKAVENKIDDDTWKTLRSYGVLPQYAHLNSRDKAMPVIKELLERNGGGIIKELPYDKQRRG